MWLAGARALRGRGENPRDLSDLHAWIDGANLYLSLGDYMCSVSLAENLEDAGMLLGERSLTH